MHVCPALQFIRCLWGYYKTIIEQMDKSIRAFFWAGNANKRKYHFVKWKWIVNQKIKGAWVWRIYSNSTLVWCANGGGNWNMTQVLGKISWIGNISKGLVFFIQSTDLGIPLCSLICCSLKTYTYVGGGCMLEMVLWIDFWEIHGVVLALWKTCFLRFIYNICNEHNVTLATSAAMGWNFTFRRWMKLDLALQRDGWPCWLRLVSIKKRTTFLEVV
jgi:hypothetical protein